MKLRKLEVMKHLQAAALLKEEDMNDELQKKKKLWIFMLRNISGNSNMLTKKWRWRWKLGN